MMSDVVKLALIATISPTTVAVCGVILGWLNRGKLKELHISLNSRLSQLLAANSKAAHAEGVIAGALGVQEPPQPLQPDR